MSFGPVTETQRGETHVVGLLVVAHWRDLPKAVPEAWAALFERQAELMPYCGPLGRFVEVSISEEDGTYEELVGLEMLADGPVPRGMRKVIVPAGEYLRCDHDGPLAGIADGFGALLAAAHQREWIIGDLKLDFGYSPGLPAAPHQLFVGSGSARLI